MGDEKKSATSDPISTVDPYEYLQMTLHPDGTVTRGLAIPQVPASADPSATTLSKDLPINHHKGTWARLYLPNSALDNPRKLPLVVYFHGGGFVISHVDSKFTHDFCDQMAAAAAALVVSVEYRTAPEHRLPAAYDDAVEALAWIKESFAGADDGNWISKYGDPSSCFLMGTSAGGNIAYHVGLRAAVGLDLSPVRIRGLILHVPFFGGAARTESERRLDNNPYLPVAGAELMWELALPAGADRDHEYCNPLKGGGSGELERVRELGWKVLLTGWTGDPLVDRQVELGKVLEGRGVSVVAHIMEGGYHSIDLLDPTMTSPYLELIKDFVFSTL